MVATEVTGAEVLEEKSIEWHILAMISSLNTMQACDTTKHAARS
jgi:hypothetical protein